MNITELLKAQGVEDAKIKEITDAMKENKIYTAGAENLDIRYNKLKKEFDELNANAEKSKAKEQDDADRQKTIDELNTQIATLKAEKQTVETESAVKIALLNAKATDVDYLTFKLKEGGNVETDADGKIKGLDDAISKLKTQFPTQFESEKQDAQFKPLPLNKEHDPNADGMTKKDFLHKSYAERNQFAVEHPNEYRVLMDK